MRQQAAAGSAVGSLEAAANLNFSWHTQVRSVVPAPDHHHHRPPLELALNDGWIGLRGRSAAELPLASLVTQVEALKRQIEFLR